MRYTVLVFDRLLDALWLVFGTDERVEDRQYVTAILDHARENTAKFRFAFRVLMPPGQNRSGHSNIATQLVRGMSAKEQTVEKCRFALRKAEIRNDFGRQHGSNGRHSKNAVYSKSLPRQVGQRISCR